ncbi:MAG: hypothetical protein ACI4TT_02690 [Christensenellales bacterium]
MNKALINFDYICKCANEEFLKNGKSAQFISYENRVLENQRADENYFFAREVNGADPIAHGKIVLRYGDEELNFLYGMDVKGCDVNAHTTFLKNHKAYKLAKKLQKEHTPLCEL